MCWSGCALYRTLCEHRLPSSYHVFATACLLCADASACDVVQIAIGVGTGWAGLSAYAAATGYPVLIYCMPLPGCAYNSSRSSRPRQALLSAYALAKSCALLP
eukprot:3181845-Rhodomonas_salina.1